MVLLILGLVLFLGMHALSRFRSARAGLQARLGNGPFKLAYSALAGTGLALIIVGYGAARAAGSAQLWTPPAFAPYVAMALTAPMFVLLAVAYLPGRLKAVIPHPMLLAVKMWATAHLIANGDLASVLLFGGFLAWAVFARVRLGREQRQSVAWAPTDFAAVGVGVALWIIFMLWLHPLLIGVPVVSMG